MVPRLSREPLPTLGGDPVRVVGRIERANDGLDMPHVYGEALGLFAFLGFGRRNRNAGELGGRPQGDRNLR
jgi:hypothetical protein